MEQSIHFVSIVQGILKSYLPFSLFSGRIIARQQIAASRDIIRYITCPIADNRWCDAGFKTLWRVVQPMAGIAEQECCRGWDQAAEEVGDETVFDWGLPNAVKYNEP